MPNRYVKNSSLSRELNDLLSSLLAAECIMPSRRFWLLSPWISDMEVIDNTHRRFRTFFPDAFGKIMLSDVIGYLGKKGTLVHVVTTKAGGFREGTEKFIENLKKVCPAAEVRFDDKLHEKGMLTDNFYLSGSMNFTFSGLNINRESIALEVDQKEIAGQHVLMSDYWDSLSSK